MSFIVWCELVCDICSTTVAGQFTSKSVPRRAMKREAVDGQGWRVNRDETLCRVCCESKEGQQMSECIECGAKVRNSDPVCGDCLDAMAAFIALTEYREKDGKALEQVAKEIEPKEPKE